jgi:hypothetical protein
MEREELGEDGFEGGVGIHRIPIRCTDNTDFAESHGFLFFSTVHGNPKGLLCLRKILICQKDL